jgi:hypothetical protein
VRDLLCELGHQGPLSRDAHLRLLGGPLRGGPCYPPGGGPRTRSERGRGTVGTTRVAGLLILGVVGDKTAVKLLTAATFAAFCAGVARLARVPQPGSPTAAIGLLWGLSFDARSGGAVEPDRHLAGRGEAVGLAEPEQVLRELTADGAPTPCAASAVVSNAAWGASACLAASGAPRPNAGQRGCAASAQRDVANCTTSTGCRRSALHDQAR